MTFAIKVSDEGFDGDSAGNQNLTFNSGLGTMQVHKAGEMSITTSGIPLNKTKKIYHGLGYHPAFLVFTQVPYNDGVEMFISDRRYLLDFGDSSLMFPCYTRTWVDDSDLHINYYDEYGSKVLLLKGYYFIFKNKIS